MSILNPGNDRTFTVTEEQAFEVLDSIDDRIESLEQNIADGADLHTERELADFRDALIKLRAARAVINAS